MTKDEIIEMARKAGVEDSNEYNHLVCTEVELVAFAKLIAEKAIKEALAQPEQEYHRGDRLYHRGDRLICLETEEYCVIHISGTDRQWVKFPDSHIGVYTNEQVAELFELLPKEPEQEPVVGCAECGVNGNHALYCVACAEKYLEDKNTKGQK
jgi:hypothetical protein